MLQFFLGHLVDIVKKTIDSEVMLFVIFVINGFRHWGRGGGGYFVQLWLSLSCNSFCKDFLEYNLQWALFCQEKALTARTSKIFCNVQNLKTNGTNFSWN